MTELELDNCPFCGFKPVTCEKKYGQVTYKYRIRCSNVGCAIRTPWLCYLDDAKNVWNRRSDNGRWNHNHRMR